MKTPHVNLFSCFSTKTTAVKDDSSNHAEEEEVVGLEKGDKNVDQTHNRPVLVQLFSSQGCITSTEAEMLISRIGRGDFKLNNMQVNILSFHVDYWDYLGWKDRFGSNQWTVRQKEYVQALEVDSLFTPQVVVQGRVQCLGSEEEVVLTNITSVMKYPAPALKKISPHSLEVALSGALSIIIDDNGVDVMVALYENSLVTDCPEGANKGHILANDYVVRSLKKLCTATDISAEEKITGCVTFDLWEGFNSHKCGVTVFLQNKSLQIFGSKNFPLLGNL
ncbi:hypothetical protein AQUCO_03800181v1 [Aquilegia coerulea]|uniref:Uncharacterized protein n=1 Tax=Aquilegia coerulea TaxID=218851 RepID=A0A2G5CU14_AQUCA|nr:hypothetical protein AQUCO_03800181v1 [Aquilegia coerulea]